MSTAGRARAAVHRHAIDAADEVALLDMLGLSDDQLADAAPRVCDARPARRPGIVLAVSSATEQRLALPPDPEPEPVVDEPVDEPAPVVEDRLCVDCEAPVVPQTRYKLDPDGYRARGVRLLAAQGCCHRCYYRRRHPVAAKPKKRRVVEPASPRPRVATRAAGVELDRWAVALVDANTRLGLAHAECAVLAERVAVAERERAEACERLAQASLRIAELQVEVGRVVEMADELAAAAGPSPSHRHAWEWQPDLRAVPLPCSCGKPSPATRSVRGG